MFELKLSKWLFILGSKLRQKSLYFELDHYIKNNENYLKQVNDTYRGAGKTAALVQLARKYDAPIVVPYGYIARSLENKFPDVAFLTPHECIGFRFEIVLCDEGLDHYDLNSCVYHMITNGCVVGFIKQ